MQYLWLNKAENNKKIVVFFNGWAMNESPVKHLKTDDFDVLIVFDYRDLNFDFSKFEFEKYTEKYLICWSMGVSAVNKFKNIFKNFDKKIAINGTNYTVDDDFGIPKKVYKITVKLLSEDSLDKFIKNMFDNGKINQNITITRQIDELKEELIKIQQTEFKDVLDFDFAIVSDYDRIIPTKNQLNYWKNKVKIKQINSTHCPFEMYNSWQEIIYVE